jgi:hypothetical protein
MITLNRLHTSDLDRPCSFIGQEWYFFVINMCYYDVVNILVDSSRRYANIVTVV